VFKHKLEGHCDTSQKIAGSIADLVIEIIHSSTPWDRNMTLGSTQPVTEMSARRICWGYSRPLRRADNLDISKCAVCIEILEASTSQSLNGVSRTVQ